MPPHIPTLFPCSPLIVLLRDNGSMIDLTDFYSWSHCSRLYSTKGNYWWPWCSGHFKWGQESNQAILGWQNNFTDGLPADILKVAGPKTLDILHNIVSTIWEREMMLKNVHDVIILPHLKDKANKEEHGNYCGIPLLSTAGKILPWVVLNCLIGSVSGESLPNSVQLQTRLQHCQHSLLIKKIPIEKH